MSSRISEIAPKLEKLVLMLSSDQPGEVAAAAAAIGRALETCGADWYDLARELSKPAAAASHGFYGWRGDASQSEGDWRALHEYCRQRLDALSDRERDFTATLDRWRGNITDKQRAWLEGIHARLRRQET